MKRIHNIWKKVKDNKKYRSGLALFAVMFGLAVVLAGSAETVYATTKEEGMASQRVFDMAGLFDEVDMEFLAGEIVRLQDEMDADVAIVTTNENPKTAMEFSDEFYERNGIGFGDEYDGVQLLMDMANREIWISTDGKMVLYLTDERIEAMLNNMVDFMADGKYGRAAQEFLVDLEIAYEYGIASDQHTYDSETGEIIYYRAIEWYELLIAFAVAAIAGGIAVLSVKSQYGSHGDGADLSANFNLYYRRDSAFNRSNILADALIGGYTTQAVIQSQKPKSSGGSGPSLSGGGRSTVHHTSSGRTMGGGGKKF